MFQTFEGVPDHGFGPIGQLARGVLTEYIDDAAPEPRLHLGHNTLPNPPFPVSGHIAYPVVASAWQQCGQDLLTFLALAARSLRAQPKAPSPGLSEQHQTLNRLLRVDSIAMAWEVRVVLPTESVAGWTLAADALAGKVGREELDGAAVAEPAIAVWAVDRAGVGLIMWAPSNGTAEEIACGADLLDTTDPIVAHLADVLDAQYEWTTTVFGTGA